MTGLRNRRTLLRTGALAVSAGLAGCVGSLGDDTDEVTTTTETPATETTESDPPTESEPPLAVEGVHVQSSFVRLTTPDSADVAAPEGTQFVFADVRPSASGSSLPAPEELSLVADDRRFEGTTTPGSTYGSYQLYEQGSAYNPDEREPGWVAFEVPDPLDAGEVALTYDSEGRTVSETLGSEVRETLAEPPTEFELVAVDAPETTRDWESFEISITVENASETDGAFRAVVNQTHPVYRFWPVEVAVPAGERREWTRTFNRHGYFAETNADGASYRLVSPFGERGIAVDVAPETTDDA